MQAKPNFSSFIIKKKNEKKTRIQWEKQKWIQRGDPWEWSQARSVSLWIPEVYIRDRVLETPDIIRYTF